MKKKDFLQYTIAIIGFVFVIFMFRLACQGMADETERTRNDRYVIFEGTIANKELIIDTLPFSGDYDSQVNLQFAETSRIFTLRELDNYHNIEIGERGILYKLNISPYYVWEKEEIDEVSSN